MYVKICGITNEEDALHATRLGADLLGFILYPRSPRYVTPEKIAAVTHSVREAVAAGDAGVISVAPRFVGVFVNCTREEVESIMAVGGLDLAQLHGNEPPSMLDALAGRAYRVLRPATAEQAAEEADRYARVQGGSTPGLLIDAYDPKEYGGTGKKADWHAAAAVASKHPGLLLAGGLTPENVTQAIRIVQPWGVDVASGVEAEPGRKDHAAVGAFLHSAKRTPAR